MALNPEKSLEDNKNQRQNLDHLKAQLRYETVAFQGQTPKHYLMSQYLHLS